MKYSPYSFSKIEVFEQCKNKFKLQYIDKIKTSSSNIHLERGTFFHHLLEHTNFFSKDSKTFPEITLELLSDEEKKKIEEKITISEPVRATPVPQRKLAERKKLSTFGLGKE